MNKQDKKRRQRRSELPQSFGAPCHSGSKPAKSSRGLDSPGVPWRILVARIHARLHKRVSRHPVASWVFQDEQGMGSDILNLRVLLAHHGRTPLASEYISLQDLRPIHKSLKHPGTSETVAAEVEECGKQYIEPPKHHGAIWKSTRIDSNPTRKSESLESPGRSGTAAAAVSRERPADQVNFQVMPLEALKDRRRRYVIEDRQ
ncbi:hypothetical protein EG328_005349 [Venturia inaequalis]|uniref:Uncharacterized protein n=1 Tax=Venturia inaequalis TaxID=5025 RepID=A0A8H3ULP0_VENIN|nr:hypothetical protein EG328_005349 [Venturia inaequalis]